MSARRASGPTRGTGKAYIGDRGSPAYRWLLDRLRPPLWLHGHTPLAGVETWSLELEASRVVNVTGSVLVELVPQPA